MRAELVVIIWRRQASLPQVIVEEVHENVECPLNDGRPASRYHHYPARIDDFPRRIPWLLK
jgi:hypothetical protein